MFSICKHDFRIWVGKGQHGWTYGIRMHAGDMLIEIFHSSTTGSSQLSAHSGCEMNTGKK